MTHVPHNCRLTTTRSGVKIGCAFVSRPAPLSRDGEHIQRALLDPTTARPCPLWRRFLGAIWRLA